MAKQFLDRHPYKRTLQFSGYTWGVKASPSPVGPGPNRFSIQPFNRTGNLHRFATHLQGSLSTHLFEWHKDAVSFLSYQSNPASPRDQIQAWTNTRTDTPPPGDENTRLNLWLVKGIPPSDGKEVEVLVESFTFFPR